jgi:hypothetical protein
MNNKKLLLIDLCPRLPYGVQMNHIADNEVSPITLIGIDEDYIILRGGGYSYVPVEHYKPYLYPLSSMTDEELNKLGDELIELELKVLSDEIDHSASSAYEIDYYNSHHIDYRGLIQKDLALDGTGLDIY